MKPTCSGGAVHRHRPQRTVWGTHRHLLSGSTFRSTPQTSAPHVFGSFKTSSVARASSTVAKTGIRIARTDKWGARTPSQTYAHSLYLGRNGERRRRLQGVGVLAGEGPRLGSPRGVPVACAMDRPCHPHRDRVLVPHPRKRRARVRRCPRRTLRPVVALCAQKPRPRQQSRRGSAVSQPL